MKKSASLAATLVVVLSTAAASAQVSGAKPQYISGTNPRPQYISGTNPRPQAATPVSGFGTWFSMVMGVFGM